MILLATGVYCIRNTANHKRYVGSSASSLKGRMKTHLSDLRSGSHRNRHLQSAWNKYGEESFAFEVLEHCLPNSCLALEQHWIDVYRSANPKYGYNYCPAAGNWLGAKHSKRTKRKISKLWKRKGHRETVVAKNSEAAKKQWADPAARQEMSRIKLRQYTGDEGLRKRISDRTKRQWREYTEEQRALSLSKMLDGNRRLRGERRYNSVLTEEVVREARRLRQEGWTFRAIHERYGHGYISLYKAVVGITWRHVQ